MLLLAAFAVTLVDAPALRAQPSGTLSFGAMGTNNVQALDTLTPDHSLMPAFELDYDVHPSAVSTITLSGSLAPEYYAINPGLSYNEISFGATGVFYLTNRSAIAARSAAQSSELELLPQLSTHLVRAPERDASGLDRSDAVGDDSISRNDSLIDLAESALYTLSGELDSTAISGQGISRSRASEYEDEKDSISDVLSAAADLLDSLGYSESTCIVLIGELQHLAAPLRALMPHTAPFHTEPGLLDAAIAALEAAKPESEFLPAPAAAATAPSASPSTGTQSSAARKVRSLAKELTATAEAPPAPKLTLIESDERLRTFGYNDVDILEDADDSAATTMALALSVPFRYTNHYGIHYSPTDTVLFGANFGGNPNDNKALSFGAALEGLTSTNFSLRAGYDYARTSYPFDSVYTNSENRFRLLSRMLVGSLVIFPEASIGFKNYLTPISVVDTVAPARIVTGAKGKKDTIPATTKTLTAGSNFSQFSYGLGTADILGERWVIGALATYNTNPNLRAYVTTAAIAKGPKGKLVRAAVQIADDEYTYNLSRYTIFSNARIFWDLDFGVDLSFEHRVYGSEVGPKGNTLQGGQGRTENGRYLNASLSRLWAMNDRLVGVFDAFKLEGVWQLADVTASPASQVIYSYSASTFTLTATLGF